MTDRIDRLERRKARLERLLWEQTASATERAAARLGWEPAGGFDVADEDELSATEQQVAQLRGDERAP